MSWSSNIPDSLVTLVRHGQASYLEGDHYDRLSAVGERQSELLGEYWADRGITFDAVFSGPAERHRRTAAMAAEVMRRRSIRWPDARVIEAFDEFPGEDIVRKLGPLLAERHAHVRDLSAAFESATSHEVRKQALDRLFHEVAGRWVDGEAAAPDVETWTAFVARVATALGGVADETPPGGRAVVFTSAGPIAVAVSRALDLSDRKTLGLAFSSRNASWTELRVRQGQFELRSFNSFPHLDAPELLTYR